MRARPELRWSLAATAALGVGILCAAPYARLAAPYYGFIDGLLAQHRPWEVVRVSVQPGRSAYTAELHMDGYVRRSVASPQHAARVVGRVQIGEVVESPIVFWTLLLAWPAATLRRRVVRLLIGVPVFLGVEAVTTAAQLMLPFAQASALLKGEADPVTAWDYWSRFLESGGQFVVICAAAAVVVALTPVSWRRPATVTPPT